jgi:mevalonate kinase
MSDRYIATTAAGEHAVRTNDPAVAARYADRLRGTVIDTHQEQA